MSRQIPPSERIGVKYADYVAKGILLTEQAGEINIQTPDGTVTEALRKEVDRLKVELIAHLRTLPQRKAVLKSLNQAQRDALTLLLPPTEFLDGVSKLIANKLGRKEHVSPATLRWLYRVQMMRLDVLGPEVKQLTVEEWDGIVKALEAMDEVKPEAKTVKVEIKSAADIDGFAAKVF